MDLSPYIRDLHEQLEVAANAGGDDARALAERLTAPLEAATRLVLLDALAAATSEISRELAPTSVDVRLRGRDPEFVVTKAAAFESTESPAEPVDVPDESSTTRTTLRLPDNIKSRVEEAAARDGISVNTWLVRAVSLALEPRQRRPSPRGGDHYIGWVR